MKCDCPWTPLDFAKVLALTAPRPQAWTWQQSEGPTRMMLISGHGVAWDYKQGYIRRHEHQCHPNPPASPSGPAPA